MSELKKYDITTETGYKTTLLLSDEDAKTRGLLGKDTEAVSQAVAEAAAAEAEAAEKAAAEAAEAEAAEKAAAEAAEAEAAAAKEAAEKAAQTPQNKQARPAANK